MGRTGAESMQGLEMGPGPVAHVTTESVVRIRFVERHHQIITIHLCDDAGRRNRPHLSITRDDRRLRH